MQGSGFDLNTARKQMSKTCFPAGDGALEEGKGREEEREREREKEGEKGRMEGRRKRGRRGKGGEKGKGRETKNPLLLAT